MNGTITAATYTKDTNQVLTTGGIFLCHSNGSLRLYKL